MADSVETKNEPIEIDDNHTVKNSTPKTYTNPMKRSRKSAHPSKTIVSPVDLSIVNQSTTKSLIIPNDETQISTDDEFSDLSTHFNRFDENTFDDEQTPIVPAKRPRLTYNKRLEANARERERVHNLTAAFEALRQVIPMYSDQPKLSRLSILRIACSYVLVLGSLNEVDFSKEQNAYTFNECFHILSSTILNELKRKKIK